MVFHKWGCIFLFAIVLSSATLQAQTAGTGNITGVVEDESSAAIPMVKVTVRNVDTGIVRTTVSDDAGRYEVANLIPGNYEVQAAVSGFETTVRKGLTLNVGSEISIPLILRIGQVSQTVEVNAEAPLVETTSASLGNLVDANTIRDLPLNGRSYDQLISLESSAPTYRPQGGGSDSAGYATAFTISGAWQTMNVFIMDGLEVVGGALMTTAPSGAVGKDMGVDAVQEFKLETGSYSAVYGKRAGAIVNIATRSGTNVFHGSAYEFLRNSALDARNFFEGTHPAPFKRNNFGATIGGPIRRDNTFFFANYEGLRDRSTPVVTGVFPDANAHNGFLPCGAVTPAPSPCPASGLVQIGVAANVAPFLAAEAPIPNALSYGDGTQQLITSKPNPSNQDFGLFRMDHQISKNNALMGRFNMSYSNQTVPFAAPKQTVRFGDEYGVMLEEHWTISTAALNTARVGFNRGNEKDDQVPTGAAINPALGFFPGAPWSGAIQFSASSSVNNGVGSPLTSLGQGPGTCCLTRHQIANQTQYDDQLFLQRGAHSLTIGATVERIQHNVNFNLAQLGTMQFASLQLFLQGIASSFNAMNPVQPNCPVSSCNNADKGYREIYFAPFVQDDFKVTRNLTLNLGLRYELMTVPKEVAGREANWVPVNVNGLVQTSTAPILGNPIWKGNHDVFAPRIGLAWDVRGNGKTAVRAGWGIFVDNLELVQQEYLGNSPPYVNVQVIKNPPFPFGFSSASATSSALPAAQGIDPNLKVPTRLEENLSIQRQITPNMAFTVGYVGSHMFHLSHVVDVNSAVPQILSPGSPGCTLNPCLFYAPGSPARVPSVGATTDVFSDGDSSYNGLQLEWALRSTHGLQSRVSYTWSKIISDVDSLDGAQSAAGVVSPQESGINSDDRSLGSFNQGRNLVGNFIYNFPFKGNRVVSGWSFGGIATFADGTPFTIFDGLNRAGDSSRNNAIRPNLAPGFSANPVTPGGPNPDHYFNPLAFVLQPVGFYGNVGRNTLIGPGFENVDITLEKTTSIGEVMKLVFRAEAYNVSNHPNFGKPNTTIFTTTGLRAPTAGQITSALAPRQIQFGLKLLF